MLLQIINAFFGSQLALLAFECEGLGNNSYCESTDLTRN